jgi:Zinc carboxypeptidase/Immune inhibitor A peptidase M6
MKRASVVVGVLLALLAGLVTAAPASAAAAPPTPVPGAESLQVYTGEVSREDVRAIHELGVGEGGLRIAPGSTAKTVRVETILSGAQAKTLADAGINLDVQAGAADAQRQGDVTAQANGQTVFRQYGEPGGIKDELINIAAANPDIAKLVNLGQTHWGQDILAVKLTRNARRVEDGRRPATLYTAAQHAREWITPEMVRRLLNYYVDSYGTDPTITDLVNRTEVWFVPVVNPDGYDWTFQEGQRLWRKNLRDNNGDGQITPGDGVDPNRNYPYKWGYDNEGSSPNPASDIYRGPSPASEPETQAILGLADRVDFEFHINYHSAAELLLYGVGWQVATPSPDDLIYEALAGDDANPAIPGYDPDISAELYTTNGETTGHMHETYGTLAFTPEMSTCETAAEKYPDDPWTLETCEGGLGFTFPDDERLIQEEFEANIAFALAVAQSAPNPSEPVSPVGRTVPDLVIDPFAESYGSPQQVAVIARKSLRNLRLNYRINGGRIQRVGAELWEGGERYGDDGTTYFGEFRGVVEGAQLGDTVEVWFSANKRGSGRIESERFTYLQRRTSDAPVLVIANEDYTGVNPTYPAGTNAATYAFTHQQAIRDSGLTSELWDVDQQGVPHHLGVLSHFEANLWYLGDNRLTQDPEDELIEIFGDEYQDAAVAERQQYLTISVRDHLNEGGKLLHSGETVGYFGFIGDLLGGIYYGLDGAPSEECVVTEDLFSDCLIVADDFYQYYLGAYARAPVNGPSSVIGTGAPLEGLEATFANPAALDEAGSFTVTSDVLPVEEFPLFASNASSEYDIPNPDFEPVEGEWYVGVAHADDSFARLTRTIDLTGVTAAQAPQLQFQLSFNTEEGYDHVLVEAHTVGQDNWTTLPDLNGGTSSALPAECTAGFLLEEHPWLEQYLTLGNPCLPTGTTGAWNSFTGDSEGWDQVAFDLSAYAGQQVEVSISYVTDPSTGGVGVFVDDTRIVAGGQVLEAEGFETGLGPWTIAGPPSGSPPLSAAFERSQEVLDFAASVTTEDSVLLGFGIEQIESAEERAAVVGAALTYLLESTPAESLAG